MSTQPQDQNPAGTEQRVATAARAALVHQLLSAGAIADIAHPVLLGLAIALVWDRMPMPMVIGWGLAVFLATVLRAWVREHARVRRYEPDRALRLTRLTVGALAIAWGIGGAAAAPDLPLPVLALLLVLFTGLVSGAFTTLTADLPSARIFIGGLLLPMAIGVMMNGFDREHVIGVIMIATYGGFMLLQMQRAHTALVERNRMHALLQESENAAVRELSERRRATEATNRLASIVESSYDGIYSEALDGTLLSWNAGAERLYGYPAHDILGRTSDVITPPERLAELRDLHARLQRGERAPPFETERLRRDGSRVTVSLATSTIRGADGEIVGFSKIARDVSMEIAARRALEEARAAAERAAQARASFLANMSHEIRTPMNAILGFSELLLESELSPEQRHSLGLVQSSAQTLLTLIDDILDFSKIEAEQVQLESIVFDLPHLVESTAGLLGVRARERRLELLAHVEPALAHKVRGDPTRLRQVLNNLIGNAIKFTHQGEVVVSAAFAGKDGERQRVRFSVRDTGIGIAADKLETIFQEFSQADASTTRRYGGTGLGLTIARRLVRLMGGELAVKSEEGSGTEFSFTVPMEVEITSSQELPAGAAHMTGRRTLIVDDNATNRKIVRDMLTSAGMPITEADDGDKALAILRRAEAEGQPFDLVILDALMPGLDGFELAGAVRADPAIAGTRLLMLTSAGQRGDGQRCRELGIQGYLAKPASRADLMDTVAAVLGAPPVAPAAATVVTRHSIAESRPHLRILLAEDNVVNQEVAATVLRKRGHYVDVVGDGRAAADAAESHRYDVVLMDIQMPVMDGFEATKAIRATPDGKDIPIVALTAHAQRGERERCLARGMTEYLAKPFKANDLFAMVEGLGTGRYTAATGEPEPAGAHAIDLEEFRRDMREAGAEEAVAAILATFQSTAPDRLRELEAAVTAGNDDAVRRAAHAYKSAAATIRARELAHVLAEIEDAVRHGASDGVRQKLVHVRSAHAAVLECLVRATAA